MRNDLVEGDFKRPVFLACQPKRNSALDRRRAPDQVGTDAYFGATAHARGRMVRFVQRGVAGFTPEVRADLEKVIMAVSAEAA